MTRIKTTATHAGVMKINAEKRSTAGESTQDDLSQPDIVVEPSPTYSDLYQTDMMEELCVHDMPGYFKRGYEPKTDPKRHTSIFLKASSARWCPVMQNNRLSLALFEYLPDASTLEGKYGLMFYQDIDSMTVTERKSQSWGIVVSSHA